MRFVSTSAALSFLALATAYFVGAGCSDPIPPTAKGAFFVFLQGGNGCAITGTQTKAGAVDDHSDDALLDNGGPEGADVECSVVPSGSGFAVDGRLILNTDTVQIHIDNLTADATKDNPATGSIGYASSATAEIVYTAPVEATMTPPCNFYFETAPPEGVGAGKVWLAFTCQITDKSISPPSTCSIFEGYAIFENCLDS